MNAVCHRCGGAKAGHLLPCPACRYTPRSGERPIAWLFSAAHLDEDDLALAAQRIIDGERPDPAPELLDTARQHVDARSTKEDTPLSNGTLLAIGAGSLLLTPLTGFAVWWGLRTQQPRAAAAALRITTPIAVALGVGWLGVVALRLLG